MKKIVSFCLAVMVFIGMSYATCGCSSPQTRGAQSEISALLGAGTDVVIQASSLKTFYQHFVTDNTVLGEPMEKIAAARQKLGFNPMRIEDLKARGIDTGKTFAWGADAIRLTEYGDISDFTGFVLIPVTDGPKAMAALRKMIEAAWETATFTEGDLTLFTVPEEGLRGGIVARDGYLCMGITPGPDIRSFMASWPTDKKQALTGSVAYQEMRAKVAPEEDLVAWVNVREISGQNPDFLKNLSSNMAASGQMSGERFPDYLSDCEAMSLSADLDRSDLAVNWRMSIRPDSAALAMMQGLRFDKKAVLGIREPPVLLLSSAVNARQYYKALRAAMSEAELAALKARFGEIRARTGVDVEKEVVENLVGDFHFGVYDGLSINMTNYNMVASLGVRDEGKAKATIEKAVTAMASQGQAVVHRAAIGNTQAYVLNMLGVLQIYAGVRDGKLILAAGKPMFEKALSGNMASGFLKDMNDPALADALRGDAGSVYLDIGELAKVIRNFSFLVQQASGRPTDEMTGMLAPFRYVLLSNRTDGNAVSGKLLVKTTFSKPFFQGLQDVAEQFRRFDAQEAY